MSNDSQKRGNTLPVTLAIIGLIAFLFAIWWLHQQRVASTTGGVLNQPMPTGVPDILQKSEPPPTQP